MAGAVTQYEDARREHQRLAQTDGNDPPAAIGGARGGDRGEDERLATPHGQTDLGNARRLVERHGADLRYCHAWGAWLVWDGRRWKRDSTGEIDRRAKETVASIYGEAATLDSADERKRTADHAKRSESGYALAQMVKLAQSEPGVPVEPHDLDADPWLLGVENGTLDLRAGELREHRRADLMTKLAGTAFDAKSKCPQWIAFLKRVFDNRDALVGFVQRFAGYTLTGQTTEQSLVLCYGTGANGKTTLLETIRALLGDYAMQTDFTTFLERRTDGPRPDIARLQGARLVTAIEAETGRRLSGVVVKQLTGGDTVAARELYGKLFEFRPTFKVWLAANHKPVVTTSDTAIWRRIRLLPFDITIPEDERDHELAAKLRDELPGVLAWAVEGCGLWQRDGLDVPEEVRSATAGYRDEMDVLAAFIDDRCVVEIGAKTPAADLFSAYREWCEAEREDPLSKRAFGARLMEREGIERCKVGAARAYRGIGLRARGGT